LGLALAFGLGGQKRAAEFLDRWARNKSDEKKSVSEGKPPAG
jgi:hypothetical protein